MNLDQYSLCPSGNGKKIKFCKCTDSIGELDKIVTMLGGGQVVPALDRLNRMLQQHPDAACALAIKGQVLTELREYDLLAENAERFVRLQPTNPQALAQRALAQLHQGKVDEAAESLVEAIQECEGRVSEQLLEVALTTAALLANSGHILTARALVTFAWAAEGVPEELAQQVEQLLNELNTSNGINHLLKYHAHVYPRPSRCDWAERYDEARGLLRANRFASAEPKFASLARSYPGQPAILTGLLQCAIWRADRSAQADCLAKLADCDQFDEAERSRWLARAWLVDVERLPLGVQLMNFSSDVPDAAQAELALQAHPYFSQLPDQMIRRREGEEAVPPRSVFQMLDQVQPDDHSQLSGETLPAVIAWVLVYGKQTDRPARVEARGVLPMFLDVVRKELHEALEHQQWQETPADALPFYLAANPQPQANAKINSAEQARQIARQFTQSRVPHWLLAQPIPALGGRSLKAVAGDDSLRLQRLAVMRVLENTEPMANLPGLLDRIWQDAGLEPLPMLSVKTSDQVGELDVADLGRIDTAALEVEGLQYLLQRAKSIQNGRVIRQAAEEMLRRSQSLDDPAILADAHLALAELDSGQAEGREHLAKAKEMYRKLDRDLADLDLMELSLLARSGDAQGLNQALQQVARTYGHRQDVMMIVQQMLVSWGLINPDGSPRQAAPAPAAASSQSGGLWTPDNPAAPGPTAAPNPGTSSAAPPQQPPSKLWVPGMD